ncbi:MAG: S8 family serine peptidase [Alphaproteobacteria bacterium]|nr:S8 family serine peptidase [Alphaproteobacteria bacterium]
MKRTISGLALAGAMTGVVLMFQNCAKSNLSAVSDTTLPSNYEVTDVNALVKECISGVSQKSSFAAEVQKVPGDLASVALTPETRLLAVVDNTCAAKDEGRHLRQLIFADQEVSHTLDQSAYRLTLDRTYTFQELTELAKEDSCVVTVDLNPQLSLFQAAGSDPMLATQKHLATIEHAEVYSNLFNSNNGINSYVRVAVIDSGIDLYHPDLKDALITDSNGKVIGYNAIDNNLDFADSGFHGTHVAGLIGATSDNGFGGRGVLGRYIRIIPIKVSKDGSSVDLDAVINGIRWAADQGAEVINMSLGGTTDRPAYRDSIQYALDKGTFIAVASGNNGKNLGSQINMYPAMYSKDYEGMITVGSIDATTKAMSSFSNYSTTYVDLMAPGSDGANGILSTVPASLSPSSMASKISVNGGVAPIHGTSMATPVASGAAAVVYALAKSRGYRPAPAQVERILLDSADVLSNLGVTVKGGKSLNLKKLVAAVDSDMGVSVASDVSRKMASGRVAIQAQPQEKQVLVGGATTFVAQPTMDSSVFLNYQWYKNGRPLISETKQQLVLTNINEASAAAYHVVIRAGSKEVVSSRANLIVGKSLCP